MCDLKYVVVFQDSLCDLCSWNSYADPSFMFYDQDMVTKCRNRDTVSCSFALWLFKYNRQLVLSMVKLSGQVVCCVRLLFEHWTKSGFHIVYYP